MEGKVLPGGILGGLAGTPVHLLQDLKELASDVRGVTVQHGGVAVKTPRRGESESKQVPMVPRCKAFGLLVYWSILPYWLIG